MSEPMGSDAGFGSDTAFGAGTGAESGTIGAEQAGAPGAAQQAQPTNGAWKELLGAVPRELHPVVTPHLQKWESNYGQLAQQYAPWKKAFADKGQTAEDLIAAQNLYNLVNQNPELVYQRLAQHLEQLRASQPGYQPQQNQQAGYQQAVGQEPEPQYEQNGEFEDPRLAQMYQQVQQMNQYLEYQQAQFQQQQQEAQRQGMVSEYEKQVDAGIRSIMAKDPNVDVNDLLQRTLVQVAQGADPDINKAYAEQQQFVQRIRATPLNSANAPKVMPTGGGMPPTYDTTRPRTTAEKADRVRQIIEASSQG